MNNLQHGLNIYLRNLNSITIAPDGKSATMGGGVYGDQVIKYLAADGKIAGMEPALFSYLPLPLPPNPRPLPIASPTVRQAN